MPSTIGTIAGEVVARLENRTSAIARAYVWVQDWLLELTGLRELRNEFDELEVWGSKFSLSATSPPTQEYAFSNLLDPEGDYNQSTLDVVMWTNPPSNTIRIKLNMTHYQDSDRATQISGSQPAEWYRFGDNIGFNPAPNLAYQVQARILMMHPLATPIQNTVILLSQEWNEMLIWGAVERGYIELGEFEKASSIHALIHGNPTKPKDIGLLGAKYTRHQKENNRTSGSLRPVIRLYSYGGRR